MATRFENFSAIVDAALGLHIPSDDNAKRDQLNEEAFFGWLSRFKVDCGSDSISKRLSESEQQVFEIMMGTLDNKEIARQKNCSLSYVHTVRRKIYRKIVATLIDKWVSDSIERGGCLWFDTRTYNSLFSGSEWKVKHKLHKPKDKGQEFVRSRGFELITGYDNPVLIPQRSTAKSAGYDFMVAEEVTIAPGEIALIKTGIKAYMGDNEVLSLYDRSSNARKKGLILINSVGIIDSDYYNNSDNEGHIMAQLYNITKEPVTLSVGERIVQGVFTKFLVTDDDRATGERTGGFGSTNQ